VQQRISRRHSNRQEKTMSTLFSAARIGPYQLSHRVVMAPLTRMRSDPGDIPGDLMVEYYSQRTSKGGFIISEATPVSIRGYGYAGAPGIYSDSQIAGWRRVTDAVHGKGGWMFLQLWHVGRQSHTDLQPDGQAPVAAQQMRQKFSRTLIAAGGFNGESGAAIVAAGDADLVAFGRLFIANPDLPERLRHKLPLNRYDRSTFYGGDERGYIDYPTYAEMSLSAL
jgi:2,4-dienoyl-CoA reductase-like NADH-dependent reductase (Old Yellow Enzyme family)